MSLPLFEQVGAAAGNVVVVELRGDFPALVSLPWAAHAFDFVNFNTPGAQIGRYAIARFLASITR